MGAPRQRASKQKHMGGAPASLAFSFRKDPLAALPGRDQKVGWPYHQVGVLHPMPEQGQWVGDKVALRGIKEDVPGFAGAGEGTAPV